MKSFLSQFSTDKYRWVALVFLALGLAIVIIDNTVLNVAIPYILRDLHTSFDAIQWVISGYALIIATLLITIGRLGDIFGRKKIFILGAIFFAVGSFIASIASSAPMLFIGEALIEAIGASMMLTSTLALLVSEFHGKERAIAFGIWGSVAGASATIGPLLGGYLTTYYSWRWSLRINVIVAIIAILGSVFIQESKGEGKKRFDFIGTIFSGLGLFSLIFGFIEGSNYGWWTPNKPFSIGMWHWPLSIISVIPFAFAIAIICLSLFISIEYTMEKQGNSPLLRLSMFRGRGFSIGLLTLCIMALGQFGSFLVLPIFLQNVLGLTAFQTGLALLPTSLGILLFGPLSGFISSRIGPKWIVSLGIFITAFGAYLLRQSIALNATGWTLAPALAIFGIGFGMASAQLTNIILSSAPVQFAGEASAVNSTIRQIGTSIGVAIIGAILATSLATNMTNNIQADPKIPGLAKTKIITALKNISLESGQQKNNNTIQNPQIKNAITQDIDLAIVDGAKNALLATFLFVLTGAVVSLFIPPLKQQTIGKKNK